MYSAKKKPLRMSEESIAQCIHCHGNSLNVATFDMKKQEEDALETPHEVSTHQIFTQLRHEVSANWDVF